MQKCARTCGDRGVMVAFSAEYDHSSRSGDQPPPCFGKIESKDYDKDGNPIYYQRVATYIKTAWWVGFWKSYTCPICKGDVSRIRGEDVPMPDHVRRQFVGLEKDMKLPARKRQPVAVEA